MQTRPKTKLELTHPFLEHYPEPGEALQRVVLDRSPFRLGRSQTADFVIHARQVSKEHTEIYRQGKEFHIRDLGSTNGTFVNGQQVQEASLANGDIIHVATKEFRFAIDPSDLREALVESLTKPAGKKSPSSLIRGREFLQELLARKWVRIVYQPILHLETGEILGYEALGRGTHSELSAYPTELFDLARQCNLACELSRVFRLVAVQESPRLPNRARLFLNLHPAEVDSPSLMDILKELRVVTRHQQQIVLEVHEDFVSATDTLARLSRQLHQLGMGLAFDDFGTGQARLAELAEVNPDFVKLDRCLIRELHTASTRQGLVQALNQVIGKFGGRSIAEGIETEDEARVCRELGCHFGQGYLFGRPRSLQALEQD